MARLDATHHDAQHEARRIIEQLVAVLHDGEHLGTPHRTDAQIVIPIESASPPRGDDQESMRALLAAWLDAPPRTT